MNVLPEFLSSCSTLAGCWLLHLVRREEDSRLLISIPMCPSNEDKSLDSSAIFETLLYYGFGALQIPSLEERATQEFWIWSAHQARREHDFWLECAFGRGVCEK